MFDSKRVLVRLALRYLSGALIALGLFLPEDIEVILGSPAMENIVLAVIGAISGIVSEVWYKKAKDTGGPT